VEGLRDRREQWLAVADRLVEVEEFVVVAVIPFCHPVFLNCAIGAVDDDGPVADRHRPRVAVQAQFVRLGWWGELRVRGGIASHRAADETEAQREIGGATVRRVGVLRLAVEALHIAAEEAQLGGVMDPRVEVRPAAVARIVPPGGAGEFARHRHQARDVPPGGEVDPPDRARIEERARLSEIVAVEHVLRDQDRAVGELRFEGHETPPLGLVHPRRLLADDILARLQRRPCGTVVERDRQGDQHRIHIVAAQQIVVVGGVIVHRRAAITGEVLRLRARVIGEGHDREALRHLAQRGPVELLHREAGADHAETDRLVLLLGHRPSFAA